MATATITTGSSIQYWIRKPKTSNPSTNMLKAAFPGWKISARQSKKYIILYFYFQMKVPQLFPLDASNRAVRILLLCRAILDYMNSKLPTRAHKHSNALNRFASRPKAEFTQAFSRQILPLNSHIPHGTQDLVR